jgi:hypothetical protein
MSEYDDLDQEASEAQSDPGGLRKALEKANRERAEIEKAHAALMKDLLFTKVGVPEDGVGVYFRKGYDGEFTIEAVRAAAEAANLLGSKAPVEEPLVPTDELAAHEVIRQSQTIGTLPGAEAGDIEAQLRAVDLTAPDAERRIAEIMSGRR